MTDITPSPGHSVLHLIASEFKSARARDDGSLSAPATLRAAHDLTKLYDRMWPNGGYVHTLLKQDHQSHVDALQRLVGTDRHTVDAGSGGTSADAGMGQWAASSGAGSADEALPDDLLGMLDRELARRGREELRKDLNSGAGGALWFARTLSFLRRFLQLLTAPEHANDEAYTCARHAYGDELSRYHRWVVGVAVRVCLGAVGTRAALMDHFGLRDWDCDAVPALRGCAEALGDAADVLLGFLRSRDLDFPDLVGI